MQWLTDARNDDRLKTAALADVALRAPFARPDIAPWLGRSLLLLDRTSDADTLLTEAVSRTPDDAALRILLARARLKGGDIESAGEQIDEALRLAPYDRSARIMRFKILVSAGQCDAARQMTDVIAELSPFDHALCSLRLRDDEGCEALIAVCNAELARNPAHTDAVYFKAIALTRLGRGDEARAVIDLEHSVVITELPEGNGDEVAFRAMLAREIEANPTLTPDRRTTRGGLQTFKLDYPGASHIDALLGRIRMAVDRYAGRADVSPQAATLSAWAVVYGAQGRQMPHHHPSGWLSGVYYVAAPPSSGGVHPGSLVLGQVPDSFGIAAPPWGIKSVSPVPGRLVLFPSYIPHATEETGVAAARISVAFDVVPTTAGQAQTKRPGATPGL